MTNEELDEFERLLAKIAPNTFDCWVRTRLYGASVSMGCYGPVSSDLAQLFDKVRKATPDTELP